MSEPVTPGTFYTLTFELQPKDAIVAAGRRLGLMVFSSDRQYTIRPDAGNAGDARPGGELADAAGRSGALPSTLPPEPAHPPAPAPSRAQR